MSKPNDLTGRRFGRLTVLHATEMRDGARGIVWMCKCDCGEVLPISGQSLKRGITKSCGCQRADIARQHMLKLREKNMLGRKPIKEKKEFIDDDPLVDDDLWMFGNHQAIKRLQKMFH